MLKIVFAFVLVALHTIFGFVKGLYLPVELPNTDNVKSVCDECGFNLHVENRVSR